MPHDSDDELRSREERVAERLLGALEGGEAPRAPARSGGDEPDELLARLYTELLGVLPLALDERPPSPDLRERVLAAASDEATVDADGPRRVEFPERAAGREGVGPAAGSPPAAAAAAGTAGAARGGRRRAAPGPGPRGAGRHGAGSPAQAPRRTAVPRRLAAAAAVLALALVGLGVFAGWLHGRLDAQDRTIAGLRASLEETERRAEALGVAQDDLERRRLDLASQLALVSTPGVEVCPLRPAGDPPRTGALGLLFLSNPGREWYVRVARLEPPPEGQVYVLWFQMGEDRYVPGGVLEPGSDDAAQLSGAEMPTAEEMTGAAVTLERAGELVERPAGPRVLFGDERVGML